MRSVRLGTVAGIEVRLHFTFVLLVALVLLAGAQPGAPGPFAQLGWLTIVFSSVLVHEFAHSLVARRRGMTVKGITLLPIGGVSQIEQLPDRPRDELVVAAFGPLTSLALAAAFALTTLAMGADLFPPTLVGGDLIARVAWFNLLLAGFNLLPAFPLDGGRVLRAWLAERIGLGPATERAAAAGRALAIAMAVVGLMYDFWLLIIAGFIYLGGAAERTATMAHVRLRGLRVADAMVTDLVSMPASAWVAEMRGTLRHSAQREVPVVDDAGHFAGMIDGLVVAEHGDARTPLREYADKAPTVGARDDLEKAANAVAAAGARAAAVVDRKGQVVGVLRLEDVGRLMGAATTGA
jgi:stage IV sporulation protein FB